MSLDGRPRTPRFPVGWDVAAAVSHVDRGRGLLGRAALGSRSGIWLPVRSVHTVGMRFALDLVWLGRDGTVVRIDRSVPQGRVRTCRAAHGGVVEVAAGSGDALVRALDPTRARGSGDDR